MQGKKRILLTLATGTGKTFVSFQIIWKLWNTRWNRTGEHRRPRVLYLADRNILVDDPKDKTFASMGDARIKIEGEAIKSREIYFATCQAIAKDERRPGLYKQYSRDFFDLIVVDDRSKWSDAQQREQIVSLLMQKGITIEQLAEATKKYEADPFDLLCHVAYNPSSSDSNQYPYQ